MGYDIRKAAVLGAGVMGSGIAAQLANAGIPVLLLDIVPRNPKEGQDTSNKAWRNSFAGGAVAKMKKAKPSPPTPIMTKRALELIEVGNFDDDMEKLADCDWVCEVVIERLDIKQKVFANVEKFAGPGTIVTSNTSGLSIKGMTEGRSDDFKKHFLVTHFFNPVRYMNLLELVEGDDTDPAVTAAVHKFGEEFLGKGIVYGKDTTNFIANRIGVYGMMKTIEEMRKAELRLEEVDKVFGPAMGRPKSAIFRTGDLVGLDTFLHVAKNCYDTLVDDEARDTFKSPDFLNKMVENGILGDKSGGGFYKKQKNAEGKREILSLNLDTLEYEPQVKVRYDSLGAVRKMDDVKARIAHMMSADDKAAKFAQVVTLDVLAYTSRRIPEIADDIVNIDRGLRWGFGWDLGPFEIWDAIGVEKAVNMMKEHGIEPAAWVTEMLATGRNSFYGVDGVADTFYDIPTKSAQETKSSKRNLRIEHFRRGEKKIKTSMGATLWDMGDDIMCVEFHTKMNAIDDDIIKMLNTAIDEAEKNFKGIVIGNDGKEAYSAGANIGALLMGAKMGAWDMVENMVGGFQKVNQRLRYSSIPVVTAPGGLALGGGCEVTMAGNAVQAKAETYIGLVEVGVGLIPGGGGNLQVLRNLYGRYALDKDVDAFPFIKKAFLTIGMADMAYSAEQAIEKGFLNPTDGISMNGDFALYDAKQRALGMYEAGFRPPRATKFLLPGKNGKSTIDMLLWDMEVNKQVSAHDRLIGSKLAGVLTGGDCSPSVPVTEERLLELELEAFLSLCGEEKTHARLEHMLTKGKPLRN